LKIGGALDGAKLAYAEHRPGYGSLQPNRIGNEGPDVGMRLQNQRNALDGSCVGAFAALGQALLDEFLGVSQEADALAGFTLTAEVIGEALAVSGLGEHASESVLPDPSGAGEE
jgi:hypothetical protein